MKFDGESSHKVPRGSQVTKREAKGLQSGSKETQREPKMVPREVQGRPNEGFGTILGTNLAEKWRKIAENRCQERRNTEIL